MPQTARAYHDEHHHVTEHSDVSRDRGDDLPELIKTMRALMSALATDGSN